MQKEVRKMNDKPAEKHRIDDLHASGLAFWMISLMHDNPLLPLLKNPYQALETAGLKPGQQVLEVGCGPGFFTIPAAKMVGPNGMVYALDVNPRATKRVEEKTKKYGIKNIRTILGNAAHCGLPDGSIDLAFVFGLRHIAGGVGSLVTEMYRILKIGGTISFEKTTGSDEQLIGEANKAGFNQTVKRGRIFNFFKMG
jgi:ubiquinone/menaquinone biosynthesis C-methylase UbiE